MKMTNQSLKVDRDGYPNTSMGMTRSLDPGAVKSMALAGLEERVRRGDLALGSDPSTPARQARVHRRRPRA